MDFGPDIANQKAFIIEDECIGCKKCIDACPVDAIHGASNLMHSVIDDLCTGCELCVPPCPVDCIELVQVNENDSLAARNNSEQCFQNTIKLRETSRRTASTALVVGQRIMNLFNFDLVFYSATPSFLCNLVFEVV